MFTRSIDMASRALLKAEAAADFIAACGMFAVMAVVFADVGMRYVFNAPFSWSYDLISLYLVTAIFYAALSGTAGARGHVAVDIVSSRFPPPLQRVASLVSSVITAAVFAIVAYTAAGRAYAAWSAGDVVAGRIPWPTWVGPAIVCAGSMLFLGRLLLTVLILAMRSMGRDRLGAASERLADDPAGQQ